MASILSTLLFNKQDEQEHSAGRVIRFDQREVNINFATGSMEDRILSFMKHEHCPLTTREIAAGINSNTSRITQTLSRLMLEKKVNKIKLDGCVSQYCLAKED